MSRKLTIGQSTVWIVEDNTYTVECRKHNMPTSKYIDGTNLEFICWVSSIPRNIIWVKKKQLDIQTPLFEYPTNRGKIIYNDGYTINYRNTTKN